MKNLNKCSICGRVYPESTQRALGCRLYTSESGKRVCGRCTRVLSYYNKNEVEIKKATKKGTRYGFELEGICRRTGRNDYVSQQIANVIGLGYDIIPTYDGSLDDGGVEFKTPIMNSLRGAETMLTKVNKYIDFTNHSCGQHINISNPAFTFNYQNFIRNHDAFLTIFALYLKDHKRESRMVCGRAFGDTSYAVIDNVNVHTSWINLSHNGRVEFRLSKMVTPKQYVNLARMWEEVLGVMIEFAKKYPRCSNITYAKELAIHRKYGEKCIKIFNKYLQKVCTPVTE